MGNTMMQSSELPLESLDSGADSGWLESFGLAEKLPVALIFGCVLGLSSPTFGISWLAWVGLIPLLVLIRGAGNQLEALLTGLVYGLGYHLVGLSWYLGLHPMTWLGLGDIIGDQIVALTWVVESMHESLLFAGFAWTVHCLPVRAGFVPGIRRPFFPYVFCLPFIWVFFQWVVGTSEIFLSIPVHQLAYSQYTNLWLIQASRLGGSGLIDFILLLVNCVVAQLVLVNSSMTRSFSRRFDPLSQRFGAALDVAAVSIAVGLVVAWGATRLADTEMANRIEREENKKLQIFNVPIAIIQSNVTVEEERLKTTSSGEIAKRASDLARGHGVGLIFCPEGLLTDDQFGTNMLVDRLRQISGTERKEILSGSIENFGQQRVNTARLFTFLPTREVAYVKQRLVPFGESAPLGQFGQNITDRIEKHAKNAPEKFLAGTQAHLLKCLWGRMGVAIGLEIVYPSLISNEVRKGANLLVNISNLGWFHASSLNKELLAAGVLRAVENGRYVVIASNTGISAVIDPAGVVKSQSMSGKRGVIIDTVEFLYKSTPFSRMWWL